MDVLKKLWGQAFQAWGGMTRGQRLAAGALAAAMLAVLAGSSGWAGRGAYVPLFPRALESEKKVGEVLGILRAANIPARQERGQILVPESARDRAFIELSGKSAWPEDQSTVELQGLKDDWRMSEGARKERSRLMLQSRLSRIVGMTQGVASASVLLAEGNENPFVLERLEPKAMVQVALSPGADMLPAQTAETIRRLVAFGATGLKPETVAVLDTLGRTYEARREGDDVEISTSFRNQERKLEEEIVGKVRNALVPLAGSRIAVTARVVLDRDRVRSTEHKVNPDEVVKLSEKTKSKVVKGAEPQPGGVPGVSSNLDLGAPAPAGGAGAATESTEEESEVENDASRKDTETVLGIGYDKRVTVGILVPYAKGAAEPDAQTLEKYRGFAKSAAGVISEDANVTVASVAYEPVAVTVKSRWQRLLDLAEANVDRILLLVLGVGGLVVLGSALRRMVPGGAAAPTVEATAEAARAARRMEGLADASPETMRFAEMESRIRENVRKDPRVAAGLVKRWLITAK